MVGVFLLYFIDEYDIITIALHEVYLLVTNSNGLCFVVVCRLIERTLCRHLIIIAEVEWVMITL
jgi:hypothetical protein